MRHIDIVTKNSLLVMHNLNRLNYDNGWSETKSERSWTKTYMIWQKNIIWFDWSGALVQRLHIHRHNLTSVYPFQDIIQSSSVRWTVISKSREIEQRRVELFSFYFQFLFIFSLKRIHFRLIILLILCGLWWSGPAFSSVTMGLKNDS